MGMGLSSSEPTFDSDFLRFAEQYLNFAPPKNVLWLDLSQFIFDQNWLGFYFKNRNLEHPKWACPKLSKK